MLSLNLRLHDNESTIFDGSVAYARTLRSNSDMNWSDAICASVRLIRYPVFFSFTADASIRTRSITYSLMAASSPRYSASSAITESLITFPDKSLYFTVANLYFPPLTLTQV